jgi:acetylornithine aminotransferase
MMLDEIQTGMGRTGHWFAWQHGNAKPDVLTVAKALGNGVPIGACLASGRAAELMQPGSHGTTFGGNPLACRAALAVIDTIENEQLVAHAAQLGRHLLDGFDTRLGDTRGVASIRGLGLMIGIELDRPCAELVARALDQGLLIMITTEKQADMIIEQVSTLVADFLSE